MTAPHATFTYVHAGVFGAAIKNALAALGYTKREAVLGTIPVSRAKPLRDLSANTLGLDAAYRLIRKGRIARTMPSPYVPAKGDTLVSVTYVGENASLASVVTYE